MEVTHQTAKTYFVETDGVRYAYRRFGSTARTDIPVVFLMHFRGTMDYWDPLLINIIAAQRPVILLDNAGVGQSTGSVAPTIRAAGRNVVKFLEALRIPQVDVLGFSMGGFTAPFVFLESPAGMVRKLIIAGSGPSAGEGVVNNSPKRQQEMGRLAGQPKPLYEDGFDTLFFAPSKSSQAAGRSWYARIFERNESTSGEPRSELVSWGYADQGAMLKIMGAAGELYRSLEERTDGNFDRLSEINVPVFIAQGKDDFMIPTVNSFIMQQRLSDARLKIWPDSGHGFLYQFAEEFAKDVNDFLDA